MSIAVVLLVVLAAVVLVAVVGGAVFVARITAREDARRPHWPGTGSRVPLPPWPCIEPDTPWPRKNMGQGINPRPDYQPPAPPAPPAGPPNVKFRVPPFF